MLALNAALPNQCSLLWGHNRCTRARFALLSQHKKWSFPLRISSVNVTKSETSFFVECLCFLWLTHCFVCFITNIHYAYFYLMGFWQAKVLWRSVTKITLEFQEIFSKQSTAYFMQEFLLKIRYFERGLSVSLKKFNFIFILEPSLLKVKGAWN